MQKHIDPLTLAFAEAPLNENRPFLGSFFIKMPGDDARVVAKMLVYDCCGT